MNEQQASYRQIIKATSIFGGVQVFDIIIRIIRSKAIAILIGPTGIGIAGLLNATIGLIGGFTNFGLGGSAVKNISEAFSKGNQSKIEIIVKVIKRLVWITGTLGTFSTLLLSQWLSNLTFGNNDYTLAIAWISISLLFNQLSIGQMAVLQGMRKLQYLAKANLSGSSLGLIITVPLYYFFGINGIVPAIIIVSLISFATSFFYSQKIKIKDIKISRIQTFSEGKNIISLGFILYLSGLFAIIASYIVRAFINNIGGVAEVGLYSAGFSIINIYVGLVFTAMGTDYYPRLTAVAHNDQLCKQAINQQAEIALLILAPIITIFLVFINWVIIILYSNKFLAINNMVHWAILGVCFKAASWSIAWVFPAKGAIRLIFWNELIANIYTLGLNLLGYYFMGLTGVGISFLISYILYLIQIFIVSNSKYAFSFQNAFKRIFFIQFLLVLGCFLAVKFLNNHYTVGSIIIVISFWYSIKELDKRIALKSIINKYRLWKKK